MPHATASLRKKNKPQARTPSAFKLPLYVGFFVIGYILANAIFMAIQIKLTLSPHVVMTVSVLVGAYIAAHKFIKYKQRTLTISEMNRITVGNVAAMWLLNVLYMAGLWFFLFTPISREVLTDMATQQPLPLLGALLMMIVLTLISARLGLWGFNRLLAPK
ncbi:MAG: ABZJ_00895 family protein [Psychrobacter sp.]|uniref:ABZJ_00895 family protein n=1 Tax=Psychrobacter sp. AOP7-B1-24 TaxID=3457645 RepID=UPI003FB64D1D